MKKKLEAELISIAHRILKLSNKSDVEQLYQESRMLYEKLAILRFAEREFGEVKPTIGLYEIQDKIESYSDRPLGDGEPHVTDSTGPETYAAAEVSKVVEEIAAANEEDGSMVKGDIADETNPESFETLDVPLEEVSEKAEENDSSEMDDTAATTDASTSDTEEEGEASSADIIDAGETISEVREEANADESGQQDDEAPGLAPEFKASDFDISFERKQENPSSDAEPKQISFDDLLGIDYKEPIFEKVTPVQEVPEFDGAADGEKEGFASQAVVGASDSSFDLSDNPYDKPISKEVTGKPFSFGLNDRIGFEKNLFGGSSEDMNRVISQLSTFNTFEEAREFIHDMVKPDYNNWEGKDDYAERFMDIVARKFA